MAVALCYGITFVSFVVSNSGNVTIIIYHVIIIKINFKCQAKLFVPMPLITI
jgi:hypothetical protein